MKNIGQRIIFTEDLEVEKCFGTKDVIKEGSVAWVGVDGLIHHRNGMIQKFSEEEELSGYSVKGLADYIWLFIRNNTYVTEDTLDDIGETVEEVKKTIMDALEELGFYDNTGNRH